jgi:hypothetical protein
MSTEKLLRPGNAVRAVLSQIGTSWQAAKRSGVLHRHLYLALAFLEQAQTFWRTG